MRNPFRSSPAIGRTRPGERVYAVGDVHGRHDLLRALLDRIIGHWETTVKDCDHVRLLFLGDVIDRGPDSRRSLALIRNLVAQPGVHLLRGNHEDLLLRSADGERLAQEIWFEQGGLATLESYGIAPRRDSEDSFDFGERLTAEMPPEDIAMLRTAPVSFASGSYFFVHAGVKPGVPLRRQEERDLFFIRQEFTEAEGWHGAMIVHGHTIVDDVDIRANRIAIDTGAWASGKLSCLMVQDERREILTT